VGIDGYTSGTVEQTGIAGSWDDSTATATYNAWWEMYPRVSTTIRSMTISAGDSITASVTYDGGGSFTLSIADNTTGQAFSTTASAPVGGPNVASRNSAEFIVERAATIDKGYLTILNTPASQPLLRRNRTGRTSPWSEWTRMETHFRSIPSHPWPETFSQRHSWPMAHRSPFPGFSDKSRIQAQLR
jgi:hypothetical protein